MRDPWHDNGLSVQDSQVDPEREIHPRAYPLLTRQKWSQATNL
jgi:hypothetical protein